MFSSRQWPFYPTSVTNGPTLDFRDNRLVYNAAANGDNVPDFSSAGYHRANLPLPTPESISTKVTLGPSGNDDTEAIQKALDDIGHLEPDSRGIRGALLLKAGNYNVSAPIQITSSGTIVRGEGQGLNGTVIHDTRTERSSPVYNGTFWARIPYTPARGQIINITSEIPLGSTSFSVQDASPLSVGQTILIRGRMTNEFLSSVNNSQVKIDRPDSWQPGMQLNQLFTRNITAIKGTTVSINAPLFIRIGSPDMPADLRIFENKQVTEIGFENLRGIAYFNGDHKSDNHTNNFISFGAARDCWIRNVTSEVFQTLVFHDYFSNDITVQDSACILPKAVVWGGYRYAFPIRGSGMLYQRLYAYGSRHSWMTLGEAASGPNVYLDCWTNFTYNGADIHNPFSSGTLFDSTVDRRIFIRPRADIWNGMNCMIWNVKCEQIDLEMPPNSRWYLWNIGSIGKPNGHYPLQKPNLPGIIQSSGQPVFPRSLYIQQLSERVGPALAAAVTSEAQLRADFNISTALPSEQFWPALTPPDPPGLGIIGP